MSEAGKRLIESAEQALAFAEGQAEPKDYRIHIPGEINVRYIREQFHMSQTQFAQAFGFSVRTLQEWEQGRSVPRGVSKHFLLVLQKEPEAVQRALRNYRLEGNTQESTST
ncbi:helix-turn-helix domain-containing protein [Candidatus Thiosymbion oneisti]|nr:helix-turn-helix domain-containing protein [Candidatus Thiosymbion oneisti]